MTFWWIKVILQSNFFESGQTFSSPDVAFSSFWSPKATSKVRKQTNFVVQNLDSRLECPANGTHVKAGEIIDKLIDQSCDLFNSIKSDTQVEIRPNHVTTGTLKQIDQRPIPSFNFLAVFPLSFVLPVRLPVCLFDLLFLRKCTR